MKVIVVGAGAAGYFAALGVKALSPNAEVLILEKTQQPLAKVKVSGGGRCNVTHACFDPKALLKGYPRGAKELLGALHRFQPLDMIHWLRERGVEVKTEADGRIFPTTDSSHTIIQCFREEAARLGVSIRLGAEVQKIQKAAPWAIELVSGEILEADKIIVATGSVQKSYSWVEALGIRINPPVPSLFTFTIADDRLQDLAGISVADAEATIVGCKQRGPVLITHWGLSGPAILKLSAWAARELHEVEYKATLTLNWLPSQTQESLQKRFGEKRKNAPKQCLAADPIDGIPKMLWKRLIICSGIPEERIYAQLGKEEERRIIEQLLQGSFEVRGKSLNKEEFVTCGGVALEEIDFRSMESKKCPGIYFAGEVLNIDGITGGFNFQSAWTTGWVAARAASCS